jgi:hypothetical protein
MKDRHLALAQLPEIRGDLLYASVVALQLGLLDASLPVLISW